MAGLLDGVVSAVEPWFADAEGADAGGGQAGKGSWVGEFVGKAIRGVGGCEGAIGEVEVGHV